MYRQMIGTPAYFGAEGNNDSIMRAAWPQSRMLLKGEPVLLHDPEDTLGVHGGLALFAPLPVEQGRHSPIAIGRALIDDRAQLGK
jgi:hypothetical protein